MGERNGIRGWIGKLKGWQYLLTLCVSMLLLIAVGVGIGCGVQSIIGVDKAAASSAAQELLSANSEYTQLKKEKDGLEQDLKDASSTLSQASEIEAVLSEKQDAIGEKDAQIAAKESELEKLDGNISAKQEELEKLDGEVVKAKGNPLSMPSGDYTVGTDIPAGRYRASGSSNFVVYSRIGRLKVNTILGDSAVGDGDYVCTLETGDSVNTRSKLTLTPVE